jgi:hypothetical protein
MKLKPPVDGGKNKRVVGVIYSTDLFKRLIHSEKQVIVH